MCYTKGFQWGYFKLFEETGIVTVCKDFHRQVAQQLDSLIVAACGYLSPVTDPFQKVNQRYKLSEKIIEEFIKRNLPIEFVTKGIIPEEVIQLLKKQKHSFGQVSILTSDKELHHYLSPLVPPLDKLFDNLKRLSQEGIFAVCRIDPIIPYVSDSKAELRALIERAADNGAQHIIASVLDIPFFAQKKIMRYLSKFGYEVVYNSARLFTESLDGYYHAKLSYRRSLFSFLREECDKRKLTFALCMEFKQRHGQIIGLNKEFMSSENCEGLNIPLYLREDSIFKPITSCNGACLQCRKAKCGIEELALGKKKYHYKGWKLSDYRRWSKEIAQESLFKKI
jgi:DNA repair photolyase